MPRRVEEVLARHGRGRLTAIQAIQEKQRRQIRRQHAAPDGLMEFVRYFWHVLEPDTEFQDGWAIQAIAEHLEAVAFGEINRLLTNVPPGSCKSLLSAVFFPAWIWGPLEQPGLRFLTLSYSASLTERDNRKTLMLIKSPEYQELYGHIFTMDKEGQELISNNKTGWKQASSVRGTVTGARADIVILDDPNSIKEIESETVRNETNRFFLEALSNRLNHMTKSSIIVIQQRAHQEDVSGCILENELPYQHLCIPMLFEVGRTQPTSIGWEDPRTEEGECFWPERFPPEAVEEAMRMGDVAFAGQYLQRPMPRGGGIFRTEWWKTWEPEDGKYPPFDYMLAGADTAYTEKQQNDPSALVILGVNYSDDGSPRVFLVDAWRKHLRIHGPDIRREHGEKYEDFVARAKPHWGLVEWIGYTCKRWKISTLLLEAKASGISVAQELARLMYHQAFAVQLVNPGKADKVMRANRVQHIFAAGMVYAPDRPFANMVIDEMAMFPRGSRDDLTDCLTMMLWHLRQNGFLERREEREEAVREAERVGGAIRNDTPLYPI